MKCSEYAPLVSRYLDEDLEGKALEVFLDHLSGCVECRREMEAVDRLRGWLQVADAQQGIPEIRGEWGLEDLLRQEGSSEAMDFTEPFSFTEPLTSRSGRDARARERAGSRGRSRIGRTLFPFPLAPRHAMRFALPLLVIALVATWIYTHETSDWIDVHELQSSPATTVSFPHEGGEDIDYYVVQHATHQPWEQYGDEVPMLQFASMPSR